jgi:hypothetical protein
MLPFRGVLGTTPEDEDGHSASVHKLKYFGQVRFGKIIGSILKTDGKKFPQPGGNRYWQFGMTNKLSFWDYCGRTEEEKAEVLASQHKRELLLSGGKMEACGFPMNGWIFRDKHNLRWHIEITNLSSMTGIDLEDNTLNVEYKIIQGGVFQSVAEAVFTTKLGTLVFTDIGCSSLEIPNSGGSLYPASTWVETGGCRADLVSIKSDGSSAILMVSLPFEQQYGYSPDWYDAFLNGLYDYPISYLEIACKSGAKYGDKPTLVGKVLRTIQQCVGVSTCYHNALTQNEGTFELACDDPPWTMHYYWVSGGSQYSGINNVLVALYYDQDDTLTEMTATLGVTSHVTGGAPEIAGEGGTSAEGSYTTTSIGSVKYEVSVNGVSSYGEIEETCDYAHIMKWTCSGIELHHQARATYTYTLKGSGGYLPRVFSYVEPDWEYWQSAVSEAYFGNAGLLAGDQGCWFGMDLYNRYVSDVLNWFPFVYLADQWGDGPSFMGKIKRYGYNVLGANIAVDFLGGFNMDRFLDIFDAKTPTGVVSRMENDGLIISNYPGPPTPPCTLYAYAVNWPFKYGGWNIRTGEAHAGKLSPVGYT